MRGTDTGRRIMTEALRLFARDGYEAVSVESIAAAVGIRAPSLYKHYRSKRDIFDSILREMEQRDAENAERFSLPTQTFRRMLTVEQYRSGEMNALYHQYLGTGPLQYCADLLGSEEAALALYAPMHLLYGAADRAADPEDVCQLLVRYLDAWREQYGRKEHAVSAE